MRLEDMREQFPKMPESMKRMIEQEVAVQIGQEKENDNPKVVTYKKRKKKNMAHRMLVASMVAALALATTVCAGVAYQMHNQKIGKYGLKTQIEGPQTAAESTENMADQTTEERVGKTPNMSDWKPLICRKVWCSQRKENSVLKIIICRVESA